MQVVNRLIEREIEIKRTARVAQIEGMFDLKPSAKTIKSWDVDFTLPDEWSIGAIVGNSGCGKTTIATEIFPNNLHDHFEWDKNKSLLDGFPKTGITTIAGALSSVGFSSPPAWLKPFHVLSNGEKFRVELARAMVENPELLVFDEFTSVVDRTVAQVGSAAVSKAVRRNGSKFIAVSCHFDILEWLQPDWVYMPETGQFYTGRYLHRPEIALSIQRVHYSAWRLFKEHHYLNTELNPAARCFVATWEGRPVAFTSWLHFAHKYIKAKREHRTVCLPDFQGVGIGNALSNTIASCVRGINYRPISSTSNPAMIYSRNKGKLWKMTNPPSFSSVSKVKTTRTAQLDRSRSSSRLISSFRYTGEPMNSVDAYRLWGEAGD